MMGRAKAIVEWVGRVVFYLALLAYIWVSFHHAIRSGAFPRVVPSRIVPAILFFWAFWVVASLIVAGIHLDRPKTQLVVVLFTQPVCLAICGVAYGRYGHFFPDPRQLARLALTLVPTITTGAVCLSEARDFRFMDNAGKMVEKFTRGGI